MTTVEVVGDGPAVESLAAALSDTVGTVRRASEPLSTQIDLTAIVAQTGSALFDDANERAQATATPWVAVELGGVGGSPVVDASVSGFGPQTGCYDCLTQRIHANADDDASVGTPSSGTQRFAGAVAGHRIERALSGTGVLAGTVVELPYTERQFLPVPHCACSDSRSWTLRHTDAPTHERDALSRAEAGLDERVGVVAEVGEAESFPAPYYLANLSSTEAFSDVTAPQQAAGVAGDWDTAFMKALGESYERYAAGVYRQAAMSTGTPATVSDVLSPAAFVSPDDTPDDVEMAWVPAEHLASGDRFHLPAELVVYPPPSRHIRPPVTTGLGLGSTETDALLSGLYEVVERDAAMLSWYSTYDPLEVVVEESDRFETLRRRAHSEGLDVTALSLTQDVDVPVVAVVLERDRWPAFAVGSAASLDGVDAAVGAFEEALQNWLELRGMGREEAADADGAIGHYATRPDAVDSLTATETAVPLSSVGPDSVPSGSAELTDLVDRVTDAALDPYASRLTTRDVAAMGFEAVRVLCPRAQPLFFDSAYFGERARKVPAAMGFEPRLDRAHHPFP